MNFPTPPIQAPAFNPNPGPVTNQYGGAAPVNPWANTPAPPTMTPPVMPAQTPVPRMPPSYLGGANGTGTIPINTTGQPAFKPPPMTDPQLISGLQSGAMTTPQRPMTVPMNTTGQPAFSPPPTASDSQMMSRFGQASAPVPYTPHMPIRVSDIRAKTDVVPAEKKFPIMDLGALDAAQERAGHDTASRFAWQPASDLRDVNNYHFQYKNPNAPGAAPGPHTGGMAQEFQRNPTLTHSVKAGPDGMLGVDTGRVAMALPGAIGETQNQVSKQQEQIDTMADYIKNHMQERSQLNPEWKYVPSEEDRRYLSDEDAKKPTDDYISHEMKQYDADTAKDQDPSGWGDLQKKLKGVGKALGAAGQIYASSDARAKTAVQPADYRTASFPMPMAPASAAPAKPAPYPVEPVGTRERALAAGYAWLAAHGDKGAAHHEAGAEPLPADREMAAAAQMGEHPIMSSAPTGYEAMRSSEYGLPSPEEADMQAIINEVEARRRANRGQ